MAEKITVPTLGESVTEATVSKWLKSKGDKVFVQDLKISSLVKRHSKVNFAGLLRIK